MTPNPKNIGAAPEEYPIRALVRSEDYGGRFNGKEIWVRKGKFPRANGCPSTYGGFDYDDLFYSEKDELINKDYVWRPDELEILSAPQEGEALHEPSPAKGPSLPEVTQPGEGVDLEAELEEMGAVIEDIIVSDCHSTRSRAQDAAGGIMDLVRNLITRATLRRESK